MARKQPHLHMRGGVYYLRVRVPDALRPLVGKTEITKSLRTGDLKEAQQAARIERVKLDAEWSALRRQLAPTRLEVIPDVEIWRLVAQFFVEAEKKRSATPFELTLHEADVELGDLQNWETYGTGWYAAAERVVTREGWTVDPSSPSFLKLQQGIQRAEIESFRRAVRRTFPNVTVPLDPEFASLTSHSPVKAAEETVTLSAVMEAFETDPTKAKPSAKSLLKRNAQWRIFKEFFGPDTEIKTISRQKIREFMSLLEKLPSNATKHFPGKTVYEVVEKGVKLPKLSAGTANTYMLNLGAVFRYALHEGVIDTDPSAGLLFQKPKIKNKDKRLPFDTDDLKAIFAAPLYTGSVDDQHGYAKPGPNIVRRGRFWVPLLALFTGLRLNEACQLTCDDFVVQDGVNVILIRDGDDGENEKRVKTESGIRFVPVHPELEKMGLLAFVEKRRTSDGATAPLFPDLPIGSVGNRADPFSKWFARFLDGVGVKDAKKVFHSFRHSYRDALREADLSGEKVRALGGWSTGRTEDDYGSGLRASTLMNSIEAVHYDGLDLSHLHQLRTATRS